MLPALVTLIIADLYAALMVSLRHRVLKVAILAIPLYIHALSNISLDHHFTPLMHEFLCEPQPERQIYQTA